MPPASLRNLRDSIQHAMLLSSPPSVCVFVLIGWLELPHSQRYDGWANVLVDRTAMHAIYDACFTWMTAPRTENRFKITLVSGVHARFCTRRPKPIMWGIKRSGLRSGTPKAYSAIF